METPDQDEHPSPAKRRPVLTWLACAGCILVFIGLSQEENLQSWDTLSKFGYLPPGAIWDGKYWGLVSSVFVHMQIWHVAFNVYCLWILGGALEAVIGRVQWLIFFLTAAIVSSGIQFGLSGSTGIGASGVGYAMFGFMWVTRGRYELFQRVLSKQTVIVFIGWLLLCVIATVSHIFSVGNGAHIAGLLFGAGTALVFVLRYRVWLVVIGMAALILAAILPLFWCPWSPTWVGKQGFNAHMRRDYGKAVSWYKRGLDLGGDPVWTLSNMTLAYGAMEDWAKYKETLERLREIDENAAKEIEKEAGDTGSK
jgi:GlpG protein